MSAEQPDPFQHDIGRRGRVRLVGVGLGRGDGHLRMTDAEGLHLVGGDPATHEGMRRRADRLLAAIRRRGDDLTRMTLEECRRLAQDLDRLS